jgi:hypothetical protein
MSALFAAFSSPVSSERAASPTALPVNSEMDDLPLPEGADLPSEQASKDTIAKVARELEALGMSPEEFHDVEGGVSDEQVTPVQPKRSAPSQQELTEGTGYESSGPDSDPDDHLLSQERLDVLSSSSEIHGQSRRLDKLTADVRQLIAKVDTLVEVDSKIRRLDTMIAELTKRLDDTATVYSDLKQSFTLYQTNMASKIADVERRFATKQLRVEPPVDTATLVPPASISLERAMPPTAEGASTGQTSIPPPVVKRVANLDGF